MLNLQFIDLILRHLATNLHLLQVCLETWNVIRISYNFESLLQLHQLSLESLYLLKSMSFHRHGPMSELGVCDTPGIHLVALSALIFCLVATSILSLVVLDHIWFCPILFAIDAGKVRRGASGTLWWFVVGLLIISNVIIIIAIFNVLQDLESVLHDEDALI